MKKFIRKLIPPILWEGLAEIKKIFSKKIIEPVEIKGLQVGNETLIEGRIEIRKEGGEVSIGDKCHFMGLIATETSYSKVTIGRNVHIGSGTVIDCVGEITIEDDVLISYDCTIMDSDNHSVKFSLRINDNTNWLNKTEHNWRNTSQKAVRISRGAWIGTKTIIIKGVIIGEGAIVGAGSVVTKSVPDWVIVAGNPAKIIRHIPLEER